MKAKPRLALFAAAVGVLAMQGYAYYRWSHPDLTESGVIADLGADELRLHFTAEPEERILGTPCGAATEIDFSSNEDRSEALAAGWIERVCPGDPNRMRLTADGRARSPKWERFPLGAGDHSVSSWHVTLARYQRTGPPRIGPRETFAEDLPRPVPAHRVVVPGHWVPNGDGRRLDELGWPRIRVVDRVERYTFMDGFWARNHGGS